MGGKRIRPALMLMAYNLYKEDVSAVLDPAAGIEIFHNYTLLHDDLMDRADMRRGKKTVHKEWNDNTAILSGDAMLILAYQYIAKAPSTYLKEMLDLFGMTALEVCEGQQYDVDFEQRDHVTEQDYLEMIRLKTAVLLAAALKMGAIQGGASQRDAGLLYDFGIHIGLAFQLKDDFLDVYGDPAVFGKHIGGDILCNKKTYMMIKALELSDDRQRAELNKWMRATTFNPEDKISAVVHVYNEVGIKTRCENKIREYYDNAMRSLDEVSVEKEKKNELINLVHGLMYRKN
jgi:geranylgeranyl diphosphate synthase type II